MTNVDIWNSTDTVNRADAEQFVVEYESDGWYRIYEKTSGLAVEIANDPNTFANKNQNAMLYEKNTSRGQLWMIRQNSDGTYFLINKLNGQYLDVWNALTDNGTNVQSHPYNGSAAQRWSFVPIGSKVSTMVTSFLSKTDDVTLSLIRKGETDPAYTVTMKCSSESASFIGYFGVGVFNNVADGEYILRAEKVNHVTNETELTVKGASLGTIKLHPLGDITGDGKVTTLDFARASAHAKGAVLLTGYALKCGDVVGNDGAVTTLDAAKINAHAKGAVKLW